MTLTMLRAMASREEGWSWRRNKGGGTSDTDSFHSIWNAVKPWGLERAMLTILERLAWGLTHEYPLEAILAIYYLSATGYLPAKFPHDQWNEAVRWHGDTKLTATIQNEAELADAKIILSKFGERDGWGRIQAWGGGMVEYTELPYYPPRTLLSYLDLKAILYRFSRYSCTIYICHIRITLAYVHIYNIYVTYMINICKTYVKRT